MSIASVISLERFAVARSHVERVCAKHDIELRAGDLVRIGGQRTPPDDPVERDIWAAFKRDLDERAAEAERRGDVAAAQEAEAARQRALEALRWARVPECWFAQWQRPKQDRTGIAERVEAWANGGWRVKPLLVLAGPSGRGKTHLAVSALRRIAEQGHTFAMGTLERAMSDTCPRTNTQQCRSQMVRWQTAQVALIDEFPPTSAKLAAWESARVYEIVDGRLRDGGLPTIITTNRMQMLADAGQDESVGLLNAVDVETRAKLASRMGGRGVMLRFGVDWPDFRLRGSAREGV